MKVKNSCLKGLKILACISFIMLALTNFSCAQTTQQSLFSGLQKRLINDGFNKEQITKLYQKPESLFDVSSVSGYFRHNEANLNYEQFKNWASIWKAKNYLKKKNKIFDRIEKTYGVDREVITAILLVETRLGEYTGKSSVLKTLSTMAALADSLERKKLWAEMSKISKKSRFDRDKFESTADRKSSWAYTQLKAYLKYTAREKIAPFSVKGSYAGAMGISQFIPSSILKFAKDGNGDGKINLFEHADAIESAANYLKEFGWKKNMNSQEAFDVVYNYNHSKYYVNAVLDIARLLKGK